MARKQSPAEELRELIAAAGLTQVGAARALEVSDRHMRNQVSGRQQVERRLLLAMRWIAEHPESR